MLSFYEGADGVKTGFTGNAGRCLVTSVTRNGRQLISVILGCGNKKQRTEDSVKLLNYGFENYEIVDICENMRKEFELNIKKGKADSYKIVLSINRKLPISKEDVDKITYVYDIEEELKAPVEIGKKVGKIEIYLENQLLERFDIKIPKIIEKKGIFDYFKKISNLNVKKYEIRL